jgi:hypothetical protein
MAVSMAMADGFTWHKEKEPSEADAGARATTFCHWALQKGPLMGAYLGQNP